MAVNRSVLHVDLIVHIFSYYFQLLRVECPVFLTQPEWMVAAMQLEQHWSFIVMLGTVLMEKMNYNAKQMEHGIAAHLFVKVIINYNMFQLLIIFE